MEWKMRRVDHSLEKQNVTNLLNKINNIWIHTVSKKTISENDILYLHSVIDNLEEIEKDLKNIMKPDPYNDKM